VLNTPLDKMTVEQLEARIRFHESTAEMFEEKSEPSMAKEFRGIAAKYRTELEKRPVVVKEDVRTNVRTRIPG